MFSVILFRFEYESKDTYFFQLEGYLDQIIDYFIPLSRILVDKSSFFALSTASNEIEQSSFTAPCFAKAIPNSDAILAGSGMYPTLGKSILSASKHASMVGMPVFAIMVCSMHALFSMSNSSSVISERSVCRILSRFSAALCP